MDALWFWVLAFVGGTIFLLERLPPDWRHALGGAVLIAAFVSGCGPMNEWGFD